jgi:hypothetical protein
MKIYSQFHFGEMWGVGLFTIFASREFWGVTILGFVIEFPRTQTARDLHELLKH